MTPLVIKETTATPKVIFDYSKLEFELKGCSRPEDVREFYVPIIRWFEEFRGSITEEHKEKHKDNPIVFNFKFDYFNSSSAKFILDVLILINNIHTEGLSMQIDWYYDENDEDMKEVGEELSEVVDFPFKYKSIARETQH
ncbi:MAG: DUF1987 domain-containing protein [Salinivirgaceae bacterium]|nr:DUF1987 domain-containing protein [Salinivirgaceae bacterium]